MNRSQRRAAARGRLVEVCLDGCCAPRQHDDLPEWAKSQPVGGVLRAMRVRITDDGDAVLVCPWCSADVPGRLVPGDTWTCPGCNAGGLLGPVLD